jgi:hypothetical protein
MTTPVEWARYALDGYEVSTAGDRRFSALTARLADGRTIEEAYQLDIKGYRIHSTDWRFGKGKPPLNGLTYEMLWPLYLELWRTWAKENPELIAELRTVAGTMLTDRFASTGVSQARALAAILNGDER